MGISRGSGPSRPGARAWALSALLVLALAHWAPFQARAQSLRIYHVDVDQASAALIVSPSGRTLLVDSGKNGHGARIREAMQAAEVSRIDFFVATHYHEDHLGGIDDLVNAGVPVGTAYDRGDKAHLSPQTLGTGAYQDYQAALGHRAVHLMRGETIPLDPAMTVTCISSGGVVLGEGDPPVPGSKENDLSIGLLITFGGFRYWVGGDVETPTELKIAERDLVRDLDVYVANHHGADNGSSAPFLADMLPRVIIISNGSVRKYRHPQASTLARMRALHPAPVIYQTNKYLHSNDDGDNVADAFIADPETSQADGTILVSVRADARRYAVSFGQTTREFDVKAAPVTASVVIERLLPDPTAEPDRQGETVTLRNAGPAADLIDWFLRDASGRVWTLSAVGTLPAGARVTVRRNGMAMSLDNGGDTIRLIDGGGSVRDAVQYGPTAPGAEVLTGH